MRSITRILWGIYEKRILLRGYFGIDISRNGHGCSWLVLRTKVEKKNATELIDSAENRQRVWYCILVDLHWYPIILPVTFHSIFLFVLPPPWYQPGPGGSAVVSGGLCMPFTPWWRIFVSTSAARSSIWWMEVTLAPTFCITFPPECKPLWDLYIGLSNAPKTQLLSTGIACNSVRCGCIHGVELGVDNVQGSTAAHCHAL